MEEKRITRISEDEYLKLFDTPREINSGFTIYKVFTSNNMLAFPEEWGAFAKLAEAEEYVEMLQKIYVLEEFHIKTEIQCLGLPRIIDWEKTKAHNGSLYVFDM